MAFFHASSKFRPFSFEAPNEHHRSDDANLLRMEILPTSTTPNYHSCPPSTMSVAELVHKFGQHTIRCEPLNTGELYADAAKGRSEAQPSKSSTFPPLQQLTAAYECFPSPRRRRVVCDAPANDIASRVERMVKEGEHYQMCLRIESRRTLSPTPSPSDIEDEAEEARRVWSLSISVPKPAHHLKYRRSGERLVAGARVAKGVRVRKRPRRKSDDSQ